MLLKVHQIEKDEVHSDIVRVHKSIRKTKEGKQIKSGTICKITVNENNNKVYGILRGLEDKENNNVIRMDESLRDNLNISDGKEYYFDFKEACYFGKLLWMWNTTDVGYKVSAQLAILSFGLTVLLEVIVPSVKFFTCN